MPDNIYIIFYIVSLCLIRCTMQSSDRSVKHCLITCCTLQSCMKVLFPLLCEQKDDTICRLKVYITVDSNATRGTLQIQKKGKKKESSITSYDYLPPRVGGHYAPPSRRTLPGAIRVTQQAEQSRRDPKSQTADR